MNSILIESNCKIANSEKQKHLDADRSIETDTHTNVLKNSFWTTNIESSILLQPGDQISMESATINIKGAGTENQYQTFTGNNIENNDTEVVDNQMAVELCYYVNNNCQFNVNLPLGTATRNHSSIAGTLGGATFINEEYGGPCFDGTNLFGSSWTTLQEAESTGASIIRGDAGVGSILTMMTSMNFYNHKENGWCCNKGVYFNTRVAQDLSSGMQTLTSIAGMSVPNHTAGVSNAQKLLQCEMMGFKSFLDNTPQWGLPGTQFSQASPFPDSVNQNIENKDKGIFVRDQQAVPGTKTGTDPLTAPDTPAIPFTQGGANPLQVLPAGFWNEECLIQSRGQPILGLQFIKNQINAVAMCQHGVYGESLAKIAFNTYPEDFTDFKDAHDRETNPVYQEPLVIESTRFKGGRNTTCPNNIKMYCSDYANIATANHGPYYNPYVNDCIPANKHPVDVLDFRNNIDGERDTKYFHFLKTKINIDVGVGNITPSQVAEKITQVFKETSGSASRPLEDIQISPAIYDVYNNNPTIKTAPNTPYGDVQSVYQSDFIDPLGSIGVIKREKPVISTKAFKSYPTFSGFIWETIFQQQQLSKTGAGGLNIYDKTYKNARYWTCTEPDSVQLSENINKEIHKSNTQVGQNYSEYQARDKFYKIMLVGNPKEWRSICKMNPMVQSTPCTMNVIENSHHFSYKSYSIYTGYTPELRGGTPGNRNWAVPLRRSNNDHLMAQVDSTNPYMVGQYGCNSCILEGGKDFFKLDNAVKTTQTSIFQNDWYMGAKNLRAVNTADPQPAGFVQNYNITMGRTQRTAIYTSSDKVAPYYKPNRLDMLVSNIIFDGNIRVSLWNKEYQELVKLNNKIYNSTTNTFVEITEKDDFQNSVASQSSTFFDNNYVEWVIGRIDDQYTSPENPSNNFQTNLAYDYTQCRIGMGQQPVAGRTGTARFLPNIYKTYELYLQKPYLNAELTGSGANGPPVQSIKNCLAPYTDTDGINGTYAMVNEATCYTPDNMDDPSYNEENNGQSVFRTNNAGYDMYNIDISVPVADPSRARPLTNNSAAKRRGGKRNFGLPSWSTFGRDFDPTAFTTNSSGYNPYKFDPESNNNPSRAYQKAMRRCVKGFRYLPQIDNNGNKITYWNKDSALKETIPLPTSIASKFSTRPQTANWFSPQGRLDFDDLWKQCTTLNRGKGIGVIPLFYKNDPVVLASLNKGGTADPNADRVCNLPFLTIILQQQEDDDMFPVCETGEYLSLGTQPSLSQNELAFPASTQQVNLQENPSSILSQSILHNGDTNVQNTYYQQNVGQQDGFGATENLLTDSTNQVKNLIGLNPSQRENLTEFLASGGKTMANTIQVGANDINIEYNQDSNKFSFNNLHTLSATGNGVFQLGSFGPNPSPETPVINSMNKQSAFSQQINLPCGYIEKNNDLRAITGLADASGNWATSTNYAESNYTGGPELAIYPPDFYSPGSCGGFGVDQSFIRVRQAQSIDGNVIQQTYSNLDPSNNDIHMRTIGNSFTIYETQDLSKNVLFTQSVEPGCITRQGYDTFGGQGYRFNFPLTGIGHTSKIILNPTHMSPYNISQYKLRCFTQKWIIDGETPNQTINTHEDIDAGIVVDDIDIKNIMFLLPPTLRPYAYVRNNPLPYASTGSQSGVGINNIFSKTLKDTEIELSSLSYRDYEGSLFDKLGFQLNQFKPIFSLSQTILETEKFNKFVGTQVNAYKTFLNQLSPVSTNQIITSSNALALVNGFGTASFDQPRDNPNFDMPMFNLGQINASASATQNTANLLAINPPSYINFPYLVAHSNIIAGCDLQYMGGQSGRQLLPAIAPLQTNYALNDFIYVGRSDLIFTITKPTPLTELQTSIHYPTGELAENILDNNSSVIYRIDFAERDLDDFVNTENDDDERK